MATSTTRELRSEEKRLLALLGIPTFALALATTVVTTYLPKLARDFTGSTVVIGTIISAEGLLALFLPLLAGAWSDRLRTPLGGRLPFVLGAIWPLALALSVMGWVGSLPLLAVVVLGFFAAYFLAYEPYRALYPDVLDDEVAGRSQSTQAVWRGLGTFVALVGGGLLFALSKPLPFMVAAGIAVVAVGGFGHALLRRRGVPEQPRRGSASLRDDLGAAREALADGPALRRLLIANALWELSLGALKTFIVLFLTLGLGFSVATAALLIGGGALFVLAGASVSGPLGDRLGRVRVMRIVLVIYAAALVIPFLSQTPYLLLPAVPIICTAGGVVMSLPYALLMPLMPERAHGAMTGLYSMSRGVGTMLGPLLAGLAVQLLRGPLSGTEGYAAMWLVCALAVAASLPVLGRGDLEQD